MSKTDLKFFTNEPERDLYTRFAAILKSNTQFFDVLVGYFRTSGFFRMWEAMQSVEKIRILVGLNVDHFTVKLIDRMKDKDMEEVKYEIIESFGVLSTTPSGWSKELNLISWNGREPKYDVRQWAPDHAKMGKGVSLSREEAEELKNLLTKWLPK